MYRLARALGARATGLVRGAQTLLRSLHVPVLGLSFLGPACGARDSEPKVEPALAAPAPPPTVAAAPSFDHLVLVTLDTLRPDHLESYGYPRSTAPFFTQLAREGVLFENALASVSHTAPSHATMLTGMPPRVHGVRKNGNKLAEPASSLPAHLRARGFASGAFLSAFFLSGIARGFDHVVPTTPTTPELIDQAIAWARERGDAPYFLWLHLYEPHKWKRPKYPASARQAVVASHALEGSAFYDYIARLHGFPRLAPDAPFDLPWAGADGKGGSHGPGSKEDVMRYIDDYDGLIRFADEQVQRLYQALETPERKGLWILTSDHGEGLGSHGYEGHGGRIYNEQLRVALLFHATDGSFPTGRRVADHVGHVDLMPTLAELFGFAWSPPRAEYFGRSLAPLLHGEVSSSEHLFFAEQRRAEDAEAGDGGEMVAIQDGRLKLIRYPDGREELFALQEDPQELRDLPAADPRRAELRRALERHLEAYSKLGEGDLEEPAPEFQDELRDLGYAR